MLSSVSRLGNGTLSQEEKSETVSFNTLLLLLGFVIIAVYLYLLLIDKLIFHTYVLSETHSIHRI